MKFTGLRILGFKTFVEPTQVPIEPGLTGIIGPNGCGKSNLVEALRFVMGESSYKALRGSGMDDVIFSGSGKRPSRNNAEVTLYADREGVRSASIAPDADALEISRKIERELGSTYRVNGREVRARDVQLLFADVASGARSSAMVRQGQIAELIAAKPTQRRSILEDAAGISGLHSRRNEAEGRLKAAETNLERLDDVMSEIAGQLDGLKRQARQAVRYRNLSDEIRKTEAALFLVRWQAACARVGEAEAVLSSLSADVATATAAQAEAARNEAVSASRLPSLREKAAGARAAVHRLRSFREELDREETRQKERRAELRQRRTQAVSDLAHETEIEDEAKAAAGQIDAEEERLVAERAGLKDRMTEATGHSDQAALQLREGETALAGATAALASAAAERAARKRALSEAEAKLSRLKSEGESARRECAKIEAERASDTALEQAKARFATAEEALAGLEASQQALETGLAEARQAEQRARPAKDEADRALAALQTEARTLSRMLEAERPGRFAPVIDALDVDEGYEQALVAALGDDLEASLDPAAPSHWGPVAKGWLDRNLPADTDCLADHVRGPDVLARRLKQVAVIDDAQAEALVEQLWPGQRLVSREGGLWRWDGFRVRAGAPTAAARRLEQKNRLSALIGEIRSAQDKVKEAGEAFEAARQARASAERGEQENRNASRSARQALDAARAHLAEAERRAGRFGERLSALAAALARIEADTARAEADLATAREALDATPETPALEEARRAALSQVEQLRLKAGEARLALDRLTGEDRVAERRLGDLAADRERWKQRVARATTRVAELTERLTGLDTEIFTLDREPELFDERRRKLLTETGTAELAAQLASEAANNAEKAHKQAVEKAREALENLSRAREKRARDEERAESARQRRDEITAQIHGAFGKAPQELAAIADLRHDSAPLPEPAGLEARIERLKSEREKLGIVNLRAEEEAAEIDTRLATMTSERGDVEAAIRRLRQGIQDLNREGRERLLAAFTEVDAHFRSLFTHLFGGGTAELALTESDDPLDAGLEIIARPPGKKPQIMTLLSGGEQALTAMSLIFAVFLTNPSPLCVLDEVDAPLDDANVERFCALLEDMRKRTETRFLVITHNPITMAHMDRLFGVTMAERGVSQLVSVDLETAEAFREAS
ncbi:condensin subunit Smc [Faunimonas pinastri]|uniref:Chromosome partition protein Smc n=1 Tax=Faunimonas pinastri TaxID=1855383 RepID=A0A1H8ZRF3_9HYPH|nr:AAA family ATPase [Faunimonas pinastri]SEP66992.1 condensin subunit Smc [Faunimonas pinastri]